MGSFPIHHRRKSIRLCVGFWEWATGLLWERVIASNGVCFGFRCHCCVKLRLLKRKVHSRCQRKARRCVVCGAIQSIISSSGHMLNRRLDLNPAAALNKVLRLTKTLGEVAQPASGILKTWITAQKKNFYVWLGIWKRYRANVWQGINNWTWANIILTMRFHVSIRWDWMHHFDHNCSVMISASVCFRMSACL